MPNVKKFLDANGVDFLWNRVTAELDKKEDSANLATVATSGSYDDLQDKPTIPSIEGLATTQYVDEKTEKINVYFTVNPNNPSAEVQCSHTIIQVKEAFLNGKNIIGHLNMGLDITMTCFVTNASGFVTFTFITDMLINNILRFVVTANENNSTWNFKEISILTADITNIQDIQYNVSNIPITGLPIPVNTTDAANKQYVDDAIPTNVSELTNDAGYLTQHQDISGKANIADLATVATSGSYNDLLNKPTNVSAFTNDAGYLTSFIETDPTVPAWAKAQTKPTYTASEVGAPTVAEMNTAIGTAIGNVHQFNLAIAQELPTQDIDTHTIYLIPKTGETNDVYDEYVYINNAWEMIGNTQIDLSNYVQKTDYVTQSTDGIMLAKDKKFIDDAHINLINQAYVDNTKTYNVYNGNYEIDNDKIILTADGTSKKATIEYYDNFDVSLNDLIYIAATITSGLASVTCGIGYGSGSSTSTISTANIPRRRAHIFNANQIDKLNYITFYIRGQNANSMQNTPLFIENIVYINLTKIFGSGNEPTAETINDIITNNDNVLTSLNLINDKLLYNTVLKDAPVFMNGLSLGRKENTNIGTYASALGTSVEASGSYSFAEGSNTIAAGFASHAAGLYTVANGRGQYVYGKYNVPDSYDNWPEWTANTEYIIGDKVKVTTINNDTISIMGYICKIANNDAEFTYGNWTNVASDMNFINIVGNGSLDNRSNAYSLDWDGTGHYNGDVYVGCNNDSTGGNKVATVAEVEQKAPVIYATGTSPITNAIPNSKLKSLTLTIVGDPTDVGTSSASVTVGPSTTAAEGTTYTKSFDPIYEGTLDFVSGKLTITKAILDLGSIGYNYDDTHHYFYSQALYGIIDTDDPIYSSDMTVHTVEEIQSGEEGVAFGGATYIYVYNDNYVGMTIDEFKAAVAGKCIAYTLRTPRVVELGATEIRTLEGTTYIMSDDGTVSVEYQVDTKSYIDTSIPNVPVQNVQVNGTSILSDGVANVPLANSSTPGVAKVLDNYGLDMMNGYIITKPATDADIKGTSGETYRTYRPITPGKQYKAVFFGLSKAAGVDLVNETVTVGTYPDTSKDAIQNMLGISDLISTREASTATAAHALNSTFMMNGKLYRATTAIAIGDAVEVGTNCEVIKADEVFVKNTDLATTTTAGLVKILNGFGLHMSSGWAIIYKANHGDIIAPTSANGQYRPIVPANQHEAVFYGLATAAGDTTQLASDNAVGTYTTTAATAIKTMLQVQEGLEVVRLL